MGARRATALAGGRRPQVRAKRRGLTAAKEERFFAVLLETCNVTLATKAARVCKATVYVRRRRSAPFRARWLAILAEAYGRLELAMLERALNGTVKTVTRPGGAVETVHEYPNAVALTLLRRHHEVAAGAAVQQSPAAGEAAAGLRKRLAEKLERLRRRLEAERKSAEADELSIASPDIGEAS